MVDVVAPDDIALDAAARDIAAPDVTAPDVAALAVATPDEMATDVVAPDQPDLSRTISAEDHIKALFRECDTNSDGRLSRLEMRRLFEQLDAAYWTKSRINALFAAADINKDSKVDFDEFVNWCFKCSDQEEYAGFRKTMRQFQIKEQNAFHDLLREENIDWESVQKYVSKPNIDPNVKDSTTDITTVHRSAYAGKPEVLEWCLSKGGSISAVCKVGRTPLHYACDAGQDEMVRLLLGKNADPNAVTLAGATPLHFCARGGHLSTAEVLLSQANVIVDLDVEDSRRQTPSMLTKDEAMLDIINKYRESIRIY